MQIFHLRLLAIFTRRPDCSFCILPYRKILHFGQKEIFALRPPRMQFLPDKEMQILHLSRVQKLHVIHINYLINDS